MPIVRVVRAGELASLFCEPKATSQEALLFGKIFEEEYTYSYFWYNRSVKARWVGRLFYRKIAWRLKEAGIYSRELMVKAIRLHATLIHNKIYGYKPKTRFKWLKNIIIAGQPDLIEEDSEIPVEFKTYPIDDYARIQAEIFSFVWEQPILLVGVIELNGYYSVQKEVVENTNIDFSTVEIPENMGTLQEFCLNCLQPIEKCNCWLEALEEERTESREEEEDWDEEDWFEWED